MYLTLANRSNARILKYKSKVLYPFLLQHAILAKSWLTLEELSCVVDAFGDVKGEDKGYLYPFIDELEKKLKTGKYNATTYGNIWDSLIGFRCTEKDHKVKGLVKMLAAEYSESRRTIEPHLLIRACLGASRLKSGNVGFWSNLNCQSYRESHKLLKGEYEFS